MNALKILSSIRLPSSKGGSVLLPGDEDALNSALRQDASSVDLDFLVRVRAITVSQDVRKRTRTNDLPKTAPEPSPESDAPETNPDTPLATGGAAKLAAENGIDLLAITGTGKNGRITKADVEAYL